MQGAQLKAISIIGMWEKTQKIQKKAKAKENIMEKA